MKFISQQKLILVASLHPPEFPTFQDSMKLSGYLLLALCFGPRGAKLGPTIHISYMNCELFKALQCVMLCHLS